MLKADCTNNKCYYTESEGSLNASSCTFNPVELQMEKTEAERDRADAQHEALMITIFASVLVFLGFLILLVLAVKVSRLKKQVLKQTVAQQKHEIEYYRDWRINSLDLTFKKMLAKGSEGEVWKGTLRGYFGVIDVDEGQAADSSGAVLCPM